MGVVLATALGQTPRGPRAAASWPLSAEMRDRIRIRWPAEYEWPLARTWVDGLRTGLADLVPLTRAEIAQPHEGVVVVAVELDGAAHEVAIDYFDRSRLLDEVATRYPLVFKMQYAAGGYGMPHVVPGGYVPGSQRIYRLLPALRLIRDRSAPRFQVYGRFGPRYAQPLRAAALQALREQDRFAYEGSLAIRPYPAYLRESALSRVCIDLPGNGDMCHRLVDYLAIGCCIVRPAPQTTLHVPLTEGVNILFVSTDLSDLVEVCAELVQDQERCDRIALQAREYFDRYLRADQLAGYYVHQCLAVLGGPAASACPA